MARERILTQDVLLRETGELLLEVGYEKFTFSLLAERVQVSRAAIYKYYANRDALLMDYMLYHMEEFVSDLKLMDHERDFLAKFHFLLKLLYKHSEIHQILKTAEQIPINNKTKTEEGVQRFDELFQKMQSRIENLISLGKSKNYIRANIPDEIISLFLYQLVQIPNLKGITRDEWLKHVSEILQSGMFVNT